MLGWLFILLFILGLFLVIFHYLTYTKCHNERGQLVQNKYKTTGGNCGGLGGLLTLGLCALNRSVKDGTEPCSKKNQPTIHVDWLIDNKGILSSIGYSLLCFSSCLGFIYMLLV